MKYCFIMILSIFFLRNVNAQDSVNFKKLSHSFYSINNYNFNGFSANVITELPEQIKSKIKQKYKSLVDTLSLKLDFYSKDSIIFLPLGYEQKGNGNYDPELTNVVTDDEKWIKDALQTWAKIHSLPVFFETEKYKCQVTTKENISNIKFEQDGMAITIFATDMSRVDSLYTKNGPLIVKLYFETNYYKKQLVNSIIVLENNQLEMKMNYIYESFNEIQIPRSIILYQLLPSLNQIVKVNLVLNNIKLK